MSNVALVLPDAVKATIDWLASDSALVELVAGRISTSSPAAPTYPYLTVQRIGGVPIRSSSIDRASIQISAWGSDEDEASLVARTALAALVRMKNYRTAAAVAAVIGIELGLGWVPDTVRNPPAPRFIFSVAVLVHPAN